MAPLDSFRLDGQVAVIIGGTGVLGSRMAGAMAQVGARAVIVGRDEAKGEEVARRLSQPGGDVRFAPCDASERTSIRELLAAVLDWHGRVDVLVNGAGANSATPFLDVADAEVDRLLAVNLMSVFRACQEFGRYFVQRAGSTGEGASIINVGSVSGLTPLSRVFTYSMAKAAVHNLTKNLAREWGHLGIRCNVIVPGFFPAEQNRDILDAARTADILEHTPAGRFGVPDDLVGATLLLASEAGRFVTGTELVVDGGFQALSI